MTRFRYLCNALFGLVLTQAYAGGAESHWAYAPFQFEEIPANYRGNGVDFFLDKSYRELALDPNPPADRYTLLRRLTINLTGLPATLEEIDAFISDTSPNAYEELVDRLLASPHYGERWGRHWLDVARYVPGTVKVPGVDRIDLAEEYRDYVVRSFNENKPYDQFVTEQLAGDRLPGDEADFFDRRVAPTLLSIGPWFDECTDPNKLKLDIVDEQISTVTKAVLGHDFACARCHDHKHDPIPTRDYYAMAGIFRSTRIVSDFNEFWKDGRPRLIQPMALPEAIEKARQLEKREEQLQRQRWRLLAEMRKRFLAENEAGFAELAARQPRQQQLKAWEAEDFSGYKNLKTIEGKYSEAIVPRVPLDQWVQYDFHLSESGSFLLYLRYASGVEAPLQLELNREMQDSRLPITSTGGTEYQNYRWQAFGPFDFKKGANRIRLLADRNEKFPLLDALKVVHNTTPEPDGALEKSLWRYSHSKTFWPPMIAEMELILPPGELQQIEKLDRQINEVRKQTHLPTTLAVEDRREMIREPIRVGGNVYQEKGSPVPRSVPTLLDELNGKYPIPETESGRLQLARWMVDDGNVLTARVMANRIWHWHFGKGIVPTPDNFGRLGASPVNRQLLDFLASELIRSGWSIKHLQRLIVTSRAYRRSSVDEPEPGALLLGFPKRRLEAEAIYDGMLGTLDTVVRQEPGKPLQLQLSNDRAMYVLVSARSPKGLGLEIRKMFNLFGFDPSGRPIHDRADSVTADQALWFLNNPLPKYYAQRLAEKLMKKTGDDGQRIELAFLSVLCRKPDSDEKAASEEYFEYCIAAGMDRADSLARIILGLFSSEGFTHLL